jgi:hypothetical protein
MRRCKYVHVPICDSLTAGHRKVTFSNPAEVAKTRLQLQGELEKKGNTKVYKSAIDVLVKTWRNEGLRGIQRGLSPAVSLLCDHNAWVDRNCSTHIKYAQVHRLTAGALMISRFS